MKRSLLFSMLLFFSFVSAAYCQPADAGIVSIENQIRDPWRQSILLTYIYGTGGKEGDSTQKNITFHSLMLSGEASIFDGTTVWGALPLNQQNGPLGSVTGIGDLIVIVNQRILKISSAELSLAVGGRFATATVNQDSLPQSYQSGLGSNDFLLEVQFLTKAINFGIGYQLVGGRSLNDFTKLKRGDEFVIRGGYTYRDSTIDFGPELIISKQIQKSSALDPVSETGQFIDVPGSDEFEIDLLLKARYHFNSTFGLTATVGFPLKERGTNIDGLRRTLTASLGVSLDL